MPDSSCDSRVRENGCPTGSVSFSWEAKRAGRTVCSSKALPGGCRPHSHRKAPLGHLSCHLIQHWSSSVRRGNYQNSLLRLALPQWLLAPSVATSRCRGARTANRSGCSIAGPCPQRSFASSCGAGRRSLWREVPYPDPATIEFEQLRVVMSADGSKFVYGYQSHQSELFVATGLR